MAVISPKYLDIETLLANAEYHDISVPHEQTISERTTKTGGVKGGLRASIVEGGAERGREVEVQLSYTLKPRERAQISKVVDSLTASQIVKPLNSTEVLQKDDLVYYEGNGSIATASTVGKLMAILLAALGNSPKSFSDISDIDIGDDFIHLALSVYTGKSFMQVPVLLELPCDSFGRRIYANLRPGFFVDEAAANHIEGEIRVIGSVRNLLGDTDEDYLSTEEWLLPGFERTFRRIAMTRMDDLVEQVRDALEIEDEIESAETYIKGPAVIVDAILLY